MKRWVILVALFLVACDGAAGNPDMLTGLMKAQEQATTAAQQYHEVAGRATTIAEATRQFIVLQGQQTRVAQESQQTQTVFAQNQRATEAARSVNETVAAASARATEAAYRTQSTEAAQRAQFTATAVAVMVQSTQVSASETATSVASNALATKVSQSATATVIAAGVATQEERERWTRTTEGVWSIFRIVVMLALVIVIILFLYRAIEIFRLRQRAFRDANGELVMLVSGKDGRETVTRPGRMPGPALLITPPAAPPCQVDSPVEDSETTTRDQGISLVRATAEIDGHVAAGRVVEVLADENKPEATEPSIHVVEESRPLNLDAQPSQLALPIGVTDNGELWIRLSTFSHALVAGSTGTGKSRLLHAWIQAVLHGGAVDLFLYDGKQGIEFKRYEGSPRTTYLDDANLTTTLEQMLDESARRNQLLLGAGATTIDEYNGTGATALRHEILIIDEMAAALEIRGARERIETIARAARSSGVHLISATQHPTARIISPTVLANSLLRIAFSVPHHVNSVAVLGCSGAEKLGGQPGRMMISYRGRLIVAQSFQVELPKPPQLNAGITSVFDRLPSGVTEDQVKEMVRLALEEGGGVFRVTQVVKGLGIRSQTVSDVAQWLEANGLLGEVEKDEHGYNVGRHISPTLREMVLG